MGSVRDTLRADEECRDRLPSGTGRLSAGVVWLALLLGMWLWGGGGADGVPAGSTAGPATGDMAAAGRPDTGATGVPRRLDLPGLGLRAPVVAGESDPRGVPEPAGRAGTVAWYPPDTTPGTATPGTATPGAVTPGTAGLALLAGAAGAGDRITVGQDVRVVRADGGVDAFTVREVRSGTDARQPSGARRDGLRLIVCDGNAGGRTSGGCPSPVVVLASAAGS